MNIILVGPPASGKGTQAKMLAKQFDLLHISTGQIIRNIVKTNAECTAELNEYINSGRLVPDKLVIKILKDFLKTTNHKNGLLFDGFPRTENQAIELSKIIDIDFVIEIKISRQSVIDRVADRLVCSGCGKSYLASQYDNIVCKECGGSLAKRADDTVETAKSRYDDYCSITYKLSNYYKQFGNYYQVEGEKSAEEVYDQICNVIGSKYDLFKNKKAN